MSQKLQCYVFSPVCLNMWTLRVSGLENGLLHWVHSNGFSSICVTIWISNWWPLEKARSQNLHINGLSPTDMLTNELMQMLLWNCFLLNDPFVFIVSNIFSITYNSYPTGYIATLEMINLLKIILMLSMLKAIVVALIYILLVAQVTNLRHVSYM